MRSVSHPCRLAAARGVVALCAAAALVVAPPAAHGVSSVGRVARKGQPVPKSFAVRMGWPPGALEMVNDPTREDGWGLYGWGLIGGMKEPHLCHFGMNVQTAQDVDRLVQRLARIKTKPLRLVLSPSQKTAGLALIGSTRPGRDIPAVFSIGSQKVLDEWAARSSTKAPAAQPPTLTLYVGSDAVDLGALVAPAGIEVSASIPKKHRAEHADDPLIKEIEAFIRNRHALQHDASRRMERE